MKKSRSLVQIMVQSFFNRILLNDPERKRQAGGGRKKEAEVLCRLLVTLLYLRQHWTMQALAEAIACC